MWAYVRPPLTARRSPPALATCAVRLQGLRGAQHPHRHARGGERGGKGFVMLLLDCGERG